MLKERDELGAKVRDLANFLQSPLFAQVMPAEQTRMERQCVYMTDYLNVLNERIKAIAA